MQEFHNSLGLIMAGMAITVGPVSLYLGWKQKERAYIVFGLMGVALFLFTIMPPLGFIWRQAPPFPNEILFKRIFNYGYYALFPWFIFFYSSQKNRIIPAAISIYIFLAYAFMYFAPASMSIPIVSSVPLAGFALILTYGTTTAITMLPSQPRKATWFVLAMGAFVILFFLTAAQFLEFQTVVNFIGFENIPSIHLHSLFFFALIGSQIALEVIQKQQLEQTLQNETKRWHAFMRFSPLFVMELDYGGTIRFINDHGVNLLGFQKASDLLDSNWCDNISLQSQTDCKQLLESFRSGNKTSMTITNTIKTKSGKDYVIHWVIFGIATTGQRPETIILLGTDITQTVTAKKVVQDLQLELQKEKLNGNIDVSAAHAGRIIGTSEAIRYAIGKAMQVAKTGAPVLLEGETGVGKELIADLIHENSSRSTRPMIKVNCGALPKELIESELFGHEKGSFTSAYQARKGRFELADGGTIFLDELGELPLDMQPKLLRVLQSGEFERVGGQKTLKVDVRIIAATNRALAQEVSAGHFRDDLFYRLSVFPITIPPLRKRKEDLPALIDHFINQRAKTYGKVLENISKADLQRLTEYSWPGNVRELENLIERSVIASEGQTLRLEWGEKDNEEPETVPSALEDVERQHIIRVMQACHWKINGENGAAEKLNMHPNTLRSRMKKLGINRPERNVSEP